MNIDRDEALSALQRARGKGLSLKQLLSQFRLGQGQKQNVRRVLSRLLEEGQVVYDGHLYRAVQRDEASPPASRPPPPSALAASRPPPPRRMPATLVEAQKQRRATQEATAGETAPRRGPERRQGKREGSERRAPPGESAPQRPGPSKPGNEVVGTLKLKPEGYGFVTPLFGDGGRENDLFIPPQNVPPGTLDGDVVRVRPAKGRDGRTIGQIAEVVERRRQLAIGIYQSRGKATYVIPHDRSLTQPIVVPRHPRAKDGEMVKVRLRRDTQGPLEGEIVEVLGNRGGPKFEILATAYAEGFSDEFEAATKLAAESIPDHVLPDEVRVRRDLRHLPLVTIDGEDARDFDDAVHVSRAGSGYRLVVAIADVAHYVRPGGPLDREALRRATSVYFPGTVIPMLPERLSNGICSLNPDVDRLCMVCDLALDAQGRPQQADIYEGVMRSHARLTYTQVAAAFQGNTDPGLAELLPDLEVAHELAKKLTGFRKQRGSIDFDLPEAKIVLDEEGNVREIVRRPRNDAHRLVEEFMLAANEGVARFFEVRGLPTVYRIHDQPDSEKLEAFATLARTHGFDLPSGDELTPARLNQFLAEVEGKPAQKALNSLLLRAMMQAQYSPDNIGHYGLAAPTYLHFTSPIRRYPDLMVHRLLKEHWARGGQPLRAHEREEQEAFLAGVAAQCSDRERASMRAERDIDAFYSALYMQGREGEKFRAVVTGVAEFGVFCELEDVFVEGLIPAESLGPGVELDKELHRLIVGKTGIVFAVGDSVEVELESADPARRRITLSLAGKAKVATDKAKTEGGKDWLREDDLAGAATSPASKPRRPGRPAPRPGRQEPPRGSPPGRTPRRKGKPGRGR